MMIKIYKVNSDIYWYVIFLLCYTKIRQKGQPMNKRPQFCFFYKSKVK